MPNNAITFEDETAQYAAGIDTDDEQPVLGAQGLAGILAWLKLSPEERIKLARRRNGVVPL